MESADVVVIGSGVGGMTTALVAAVGGLRVVILEKTGLVGGSTSYSSGGAFLPGCHLLPPEPNPSAPMTYIANCVGDRLDRPLLDAYLRNGPAALALLEANTEVRFQPFGGVDYRTEVEGASLSGRTVLPVPFDGGTLGNALKRLRPPLSTMTIMGGMQVDYRDIALLQTAFRSPSAMLYAFKLLKKHWLGRFQYGRSPRLVFGNALAGRLYYSVRARSEIDLRLEAQVTDLVVEDGVVVGVDYRQNGAKRSIRASRGVMLATGGFPGNASMRAARIPFAKEHLSLPPPTNVGDGINLGISAGGRLSKNTVSDYCLTPVSSCMASNGEQLLFPHFALDRCKPGAIAVGRDGKRFVNEGLSYSDFALAMHASSTVPAFLICDRPFLRKYGLGMVLPSPFPYRKWIKREYLIEADSVAQLAARLDIDAGSLQATVDKMNSYAATGKDLDFGKGDDAYSRSLGDPAHRPNPCLGSIGPGPYYAIRLFPGDTSTTCGLVTNTTGQVLDGNDNPIKGLYACGPDMANPTMGCNVSGGFNIGPALTFAYLAAMQMADAKGADQGEPSR